VLCWWASPPCKNFTSFDVQEIVRVQQHLAEVCEGREFLRRRSSSPVLDNVNCREISSCRAVILRRRVDDQMRSRRRSNLSVSSPGARLQSPRSGGLTKELAVERRATARRRPSCYVPVATVGWSNTELGELVVPGAKTYRLCRSAIIGAATFDRRSDAASELACRNRLAAES
jgi:hypothetical protein